MYLKHNALLIRKQILILSSSASGENPFVWRPIQRATVSSKAATHYKDLPFSQNDNASESVVAQRRSTLEIRGLSHRPVVSSFVDVPA